MIEGKTIKQIRDAVSRRDLKEPFRASDLNKLLGIDWAGTFLSKHSIGNGYTTELFVKAIEFAPRYSEAHFLLGVAYIDILKYHQAEDALRTATAVNSKNGGAYLALGYSLIEQRRPAEAEEPLLRGVEFDPNNSRGFYDLGRSYYALNHPQEAQKYLRKAITLAPKVAAMHALLANVLLCTGDMEGARREFEEYAHLDPNRNVSID